MGRVFYLISGLIFLIIACKFSEPFYLDCAADAFHYDHDIVRVFYDPAAQGLGRVGQIDKEGELLGATPC